MAKELGVLMGQTLWFHFAHCLALHTMQGNATQCFMVLCLGIRIGSAQIRSTARVVLFLSPMHPPPPSRKGLQHTVSIFSPRQVTLCLKEGRLAVMAVAAHSYLRKVRSIFI